jgi:hypothetical protein
VIDTRFLEEVFMARTTATVLNLNQLRELRKEREGAKSDMVVYDQMCRAIDAAYSLEELKNIQDKAKLMEAAARVMKNTEAECRACEIRLRAERRYGQLDVEINRGAKGGRGKKASGRDTVSRQKARQCRELSEASQADFDRALKDADKATTKGIIEATRKREKPSLTVNKKAVWLWGRLKEFERSGYLAMDPDEVLSTMSASMLDEVHVLALRVAAWLKRVGDLS